MGLAGLPANYSLCVGCGQPYRNGSPCHPGAAARPLPGLVVFTVPGRPASWLRPAGGAHGRYTDPAQTAAMDRIGACAAKVWPYGVRAGVPFDVRIHFVMPRASKAAQRREWPTARGELDVDNGQKIIYDALTGIVWKDDAQIVAQRSSKAYGARPCTQVQILPVATTGV